MAPQPACGVCDVDKGRCESGKETKQVAYIHEGTVIACEQSANGKEKKRKEHSLVIPTCKCMRKLHS